MSKPVNKGADRCLLLPDNRAGSYCEGDCTGLQWPAADLCAALCTSVPVIF